MLSTAVMTQRVSAYQAFAFFVVKASRCSYQNVLKKSNKARVTQETGKYLLDDHFSEQIIDF